MSDYLVVADGDRVVQVIAEFAQRGVALLLGLGQLAHVLLDGAVHQRAHFLDLVDGQWLQLVQAQLGQAARHLIG